MSITSGQPIVAKDVRDKLSSNLIEIKNKLMTIAKNSNTFWENDFPANSFIKTMKGTKPTNTDDFLRTFNDLSNAINNLSISYDVCPGEEINLKKFHDYALSCHSMASFIRHTVYKVADYPFSQKVTYDNTSYLKDIPTMSSLITSQNDFRKNFADNDQQCLSTINEYEDKWKNFRIDNVSLTSYINPNDFNDEDKPLHIGNICSASYSLGFLNILREINKQLGQTVSCLYYWNKGAPAPFEKYTVTYENTYPELIYGNNHQDNVEQYDTYTIKTMKGVGWSLKNKNISMNTWKVKNTSTTYKENGKQKIIITKNIIFVPVISNVQYSFNIKAYNKNSASSGTLQKNDYTIKSYGTLSEKRLSIDGNGIVTITGLNGFAKVKILNLECGINEISHSHYCRYYMVDCNNNNKNITLATYKPDWQSAHYDVPGYGEVVGSIFPSKYANEIELKVGSDGTVKFKICWEADMSPGGAQEFFLSPISGVSTNGGIKGIEAIANN